MNPINRGLAWLGVQIHRAPALGSAARAFRQEYRSRLKALGSHAGPFRVFGDFRYDVGEHPESYVDAECAFAAAHLSRAQPGTVLDIGSYRHFVLGLAAHYKVLSLDVRPRATRPPNESVLVGDARRLDLPAESVDAVVTLCAIEHFGLGRYGDLFDLDADRAAVAEMARVLKPGGALILSTAITAASPAIAFNAHRIYDRTLIDALRGPLAPVEEAFFSHRLGRRCDAAELTRDPRSWDVYLGCWTKPAAV